MKAYSYIRWSSSKQTSGDSLRRQTKLAADYAAKHNLQLDNETYIDPGVSAYKGKNAIEGKLGAFLKAVDDEDIEVPCYLLVEELDRISRDDILEAQHLFTSIIRRGITLVVLKTDQVFSKETTKGANGMMLMIGALLSLVNANDESAKKSRRLIEVFAQHREKRKLGVITSRYCPSWLKAKEDMSGWIVDTKKTAVIKRIFKLSLAGNGSQKIAQLLNADGALFIGPRADEEGWKTGNVAGILRQPAVCGRLVSKDGTVINEKYYPEIVSPKDWMACQSSIQGRRNSGGREQGTANLFSHLTRCAYCGSNMKFTTGSAGTHYLYCLRAMTHLCDAKMIRYAPIESDLLSYLSAWMKRDLNAAEMDKSNRSRRQELQHAIASHDDEVKRLVKALTLSKTKPEALVDRIDVAQGALDAAQAELATLTTNPVTGRTIDDVVELIYAVTEDKNKELRLKVQTALRGQILNVLIAPYLNKHPKHLKAFGIKDKPKETLHMAKIVYKDGTESDPTDIMISDRRRTR